MRLLFLSHYFPPENNVPATRTAEHTARWAASPGVRMRVITNHPHHPNGVLAPGYKNLHRTRENLDGVEVVRVKTLLAANRGVFKRIASFLAFMLRAVFAGLAGPRPDLVLATSPQLFCALAGCVLGILWRVPFVFELRDIWPESIVAVGAMKPGLALRLLEKIELWMYGRAALIVVVTEGLRENIIRRGVPAEKIHLIRNGVDTEVFCPRPADPQLKQRLAGEGGFLVSYIGTVGLAAGLENMLEAAAFLRNRPDITFMILGDGAAKPNLQRRAAEMVLTNLRFLPAVSRDAVRDYYAASDLCLVTLREGPLFAGAMPAKVTEIMAMGRPLIHDVDGELRGIVEQAGAGVFVQPKDAVYLARAVVELKEQPERLAEMGANGRRFSEENFSRARSADLYLSLLKGVAGR